MSAVDSAKADWASRAAEDFTFMLMYKVKWKAQNVKSFD